MDGWGGCCFSSTFGNFYPQVFDSDLLSEFGRERVRNFPAMGRSMGLEGHGVCHDAVLDEVCRCCIVDLYFE